MSLGIVIKGPEGVVLAADSRITLEARRPDGPPIAVNFDNATKLLSFAAPHNFVGGVTYGVAVIGLRTAHSFIPEFELNIREKPRLSVIEYAQQMSDFFLACWNESMPADYRGPGMSFIVGGYDPDAAYGKVFLFQIPGQPQPEPRNPGEKEFGMTWGGQLEVTSRLIHGFDPALPQILSNMLNLRPEQLTTILPALRQNLEFRIPYDVLPLQDCVNLAIFLIRTTITAQELAIGLRGVGGPLDVATITRIDGLKYVQQKTIHGEPR